MQENNNETGELSPEYLERVRVAFEGKDHRTILRSIKPKFPEVRTGVLAAKISFLRNGAIQNENILKEIEAVVI